MNDEKLNILEQLSELSLRMTGRSTRLTDSYIQQLYNNIGEWVTIKDHYITKRADSILLNRICKRLSFEHPSTKIEIDRFNNRLKIVECSRNYINQEIKQLNNELKKLKNNNPEN